MPLLDALLLRLGIQPRPYRALVRGLVLCDLRGQSYGRATGTRPGELIPPFYWVVAQYLFISAVLSTLLFARVEVWAYAFAGLAASMILAITGVIVEFHEVVLDPDDLAVIGPRPVTSRTYAAARLTNLAAWFAVLTVAPNLFPAIIGAGLRDAGPGYLPAYALAAVVGNVAAVSVTILLYSLRPRKETGQDLRDVLAWTQIVLALVVFYGGQMMLRDPAHQLEVFAARPPAWLAWLPPGWLAGFVTEAATDPGPRVLGLAGAACVGAGLLALFTLARLDRFYREAQPAATAVPPRSGPVAAATAGSPFVAAWLRRLVRPPQKAAAVALCLRLLARDPDLRMRGVPALAAVVAAAAMGLLTGQLGDPFATSTGQCVLSVAAVMLLVVAVPSLVNNMSFSRDFAAAWNLEVAPLGMPGLAADAARVAVTYALALPVLAALGMVFAVTWGRPLDALLHCALAWPAVVAAGHASVWGLGLGIPFARPAARGDVAGPVAPVLAGVATVAFGLAAAQLHAARSGPLTAAYAAGLLLLWAASRRLAGRPSPLAGGAGE